MPCSTCEKLRKVLPGGMAERLREYERRAGIRRQKAEPPKAPTPAPRAKG